MLNFNKTLAAIGAMILPSMVFATTVFPEEVKTVPLSNEDVNRIHCEDGSINDAFTSTEKGIAIENVGANAFVKFVIEEQGKLRSYITQRTEIYVVCNDEIYTLLAEPKKIPAQTIRLTTGDKRLIEENQALFSPMPEEERALYLTLAVLKDSIPSSFNVKHGPGHWFYLKKADFMQLRHLRTISAYGSGLSVKEYEVRATRTRTFHENDFLRKELSTEIFAITMENMHLENMQTTRVVLVEKGGPQ